MSQDTITLQVDARAVLGKAVKHLRKDGIVPAVIHDHGKPSLVVSAEYNALLKTFQQAGKHHPVELQTGSKNYMTIIKSATFDPKRNTLTHVVFNAVNRNEKVEAEVPIHARYSEGNEASPAERAGLIVLEQLAIAKVKALPQNLPDELTFDAEKLVAVGDQVTVGDLAIPQGVELETEPEHVIATVFEPSALQAANDQAGGDATDETAVPADHESGAEAGTQEAENRPGGKEQKESKDEGRNPEKQ